MMHSRTLAVAGLAIRIRGQAEDMAMLDTRYGPFLASDVERTDAEITVRLASPVGPPWQSETLEVGERGDLFSLRSQGFDAQITADGAQATLRAPRLERCVDAVLRYVLSRRLLEQGGLLLHASAVIRAERAWIFAGPSGVGKTTIGAHLAGELLCDEAVALRERDGELICHATPYWTATPRSAVVAGLVFPEHGCSDAMHALSPARALAKLVSCVGPLLPSARQHVLEASEKLLQVEGTALVHVRLAAVSSISGYLSDALGRLSTPTNALE